MGEARAGDITPHDGVSREEKQRLEREAVQRIFSALPRGADYLALWEEYEQGTSFEARLVRRWTGWRWACKPPSTSTRALETCPSSSPRCTRCWRRPSSRRCSPSWRPSGPCAEQADSLGRGRPRPERLAPPVAPV
ncbi:HD domain-containing protein [Cystobacter fuscus]